MMMREAFGVFVCGLVALMVGCGDDESLSGTRRGTSDDSVKSAGAEKGSAPAAPGSGTSDTPPGTDGPALTSAETACAAAAAPRTLVEEVGAKDVNIAGTAVFFQVGSRVVRVLKDGTEKKDTYTSPNLVRTFVDKTAMILLEATTTSPDATIRVIKATKPVAKPGDPPLTDAAFPEFPEGTATAQVGTTAATNYNAAGTRVFASDETSFYLLADTAAGDAIYKVSKDNPGTRTLLAQSPNVISDPQIASGAIWYVRDQQRVFKIPMEEGTAATPVEVFGISYASCSLAVTEQAAFFSVGTALESRDLTGGSPATVIDALKSKTQARFGATRTQQGSILVRSGTPDEKVQHVIREIRPGTGTVDEKFVACGRALVTDLAVDATNVVWSEAAGVFIAPR